MGCRTEKFGAAALLFTFLIETTNGQILKNVPKTVFCVWVIKTNLKYIDISGGSWYDKNRNKSAISRKGDGYGIGTGNKNPMNQLIQSMMQWMFFCQAG